MYSQKSSAPSPQAPHLRMLYSLISAICTLLKQLPHGQMCFHTWDIQSLSSSPTTPLGGSGQCLLLVPEPLTTSSLMARANVIMGHLLNHVLPILPFPLLKILVFLPLDLLPLFYFLCQRACSLSRSYGKAITLSRLWA